MAKFLIIDGNSLINRSFYALPYLKTRDDRYCGGVFGFVNILARVITDYHPEYMCVAFDAGKHTFRNDLYADYKGTRKGMPDELAMQMPMLKDLLQKMGIFIIEKLGIEADDIIGTLANRFENTKNIIMTGDRDCLQLINDHTEVWLTKHGISEIVEMNERHLKEEWGLEPSQIIDLKALMGDSSDNIPGVPSVGEKTAKNLLAQYGTIDNIYANIDNISGKLGEKLRENKDLCYLSYDLATIRTKCDVACDLEDCKYTFPWNNEVYKIFQEYEFRSLLKRKDLFSGNSAKVEEDEPNIEVAPNEIKDLVQKNINSSVFSLVFEGDFLHFAFDEKQNYVANIFNTNPIALLSEFKPFLENKQKLLYAFDLKKIYHLCDFANITLQASAVDVPLAIYLVNSNKKGDEPAPLLGYLGLNEHAYATGMIKAWGIAQNQLEQKEIMKLYTEMELPLVRVLFEMEKAGITINTAVLNELAPKYRAEMDQITQKIYSFAGMEFNLNSPKQLGEVLFDKLKLSDKGNKKHSTAVDILESLRSENPIIDEILRYRTIMKINSTYIEGMRQFIKPDGKIHTVFNQTTAVTGRLSSNEPNLQNIPVRTEEGKELRKMFIASKGCKLVSADYSQIELRLLAHYSGDPVLCNAYNTHQDIHRATASQIFGVPLEMVTDQMRRSAKAVNFGIIYGISPFGLAQNLGIPQYEAREYIERYFQTYPTIKQFLDSSVEKYKEKGYVTTLFGRIRNFDNVAPKVHDAKFSERAAMNMPLQGTASDIIKIAMLNVDRALHEQNLKAKLILQIHDELIVDTPEDEVEKVVNILHTQMENVIKLRVPLEVDVEVGDSWYDI